MQRYAVEYMKSKNRFSEWITINDILTGIRFISKLPSFLRNSVRANEVKDILRRRFEHSKFDFLTLVRSAIYQNPRSPYRKLLKHSGCEYGDLDKLVNKEGVEGALQALYRNRIFLTVNEFKGRVPVVRESTEINFRPELLVNPLSNQHISASSSGSSGRRVPVLIDLAFIRDRSINYRLAMEFRKSSNWRHSVWGVPGNTDIVMLLELSFSGARKIRWFSQVKLNARELHPRYRWSARAMHWAASLTRASITSPEYVPLNDPIPIVHWLRKVLDAGETPHITTFVSPALRICQAASSQRIDISGTQFTVGGEPMTNARLAIIHGSGAIAVPRFMATECGYIGYGCLNPNAPDDYHCFNDFNAVIQAGQVGKHHGLPSNALLISSMRPTAPFILLNVSLGDQALMKHRSCGCPLGEFGWTTHLSMVRSFEKLTSGGMTFLDRDVIHILEEVLPSRFGGTPVDYQLVEKESSDGEPQILLVISPAVGPVDTKAVLDTFLQEISKGSGAERVMGLQWKNAGFVLVKRQVPETTSTGKILHLLKPGN